MTKVLFKRKSTDEIATLPVEDGTIIYNHQTGATYLDYGNERIPTGGGMPTGDTYPIGAIAPYGGDTAPTNWLICDGSAVSRVTYADLFSVIGTTFGAGDGSTTFNLPDLRSRVPLGKDSRDGDFDTIGETYGEKKHTLTVDEMPSHRHNFIPTAGDTAGSYGNICTTGNYVENLNKDWVQPAGGSQPHNIVQPSLVTNYIIKAFQSAGVVATVANAKSTSNTDTYSCDYLNKNIMTLSLLASETNTSTAAYQAKLLHLTLFNSVGNKLTYANNKIIIGSGVSKVKINAHMVGTSFTPNNGYGLRVFKEGNENKQVAFSLVRPSDSHFKEFDVSGVLYDVEENDQIGLYTYIDQADNTIEAVGSPDYAITYLTVEVVE